MNLVRRYRLRWAVLILVMIELLTIVVYLGPAIPTDVKPAADGGTVFSAENALKLHRELLPDEPHPSGSAANEQTRLRIADWLRSRGWVVEFHPDRAAADQAASDQAANSDGAKRPTEPDSGASVISWTNILAYRPEQKNLTGTPLVFSSHFDSCRFGPGAGDAGGCVAAILEATQCLVNRELAWQRPIYILLTDAEEDGLVGARGFMQFHPLAKEKPVVFNLDARGNRGPAVMYETHVGNAAEIRVWSSRIARPIVTGSQFTAIYRMMPNGTDFTEFINGGWTGFNFALIDGADHYHQPTDTVDRLSPGSVQHFGNHVMSLGEDIGTSLELPARSTGDAVFFDVFGQFVVSWPDQYAGAIAIVVFVISAGIHRSLWTTREGRISMTLVFFAGLIILFVAGIIGLGASGIFREVGLLPRAHVAWGHWLSALLCGLTLFFSVLVAAGCLYRRSAEFVWAAHGFWASVLCLIVSILAPAFSHLVLIPAVASLVLSVVRVNVVIRALCFVAAFGVIVIPLQHLISIALGPLAGIALALVFSTNGLALLPLIPRELIGGQASSNLKGQQPV